MGSRSYHYKPSTSKTMNPYSIILLAIAFVCLAIASGLKIAAYNAKRANDYKSAARALTLGLAERACKRQQSELKAREQMPARTFRQPCNLDTWSREAEYKHAEITTRQKPYSKATIETHFSNLNKI